MQKLKSVKFLPIIIIITALAAVGIWRLAPLSGGLPPAELAAIATQDMAALTGLTYHTETQLSINGDTIHLGSIDGQINGENLHIWGNTLGSDINIYQIGPTTYRQDTLTEQWLTTNDGELLNGGSLLNVADPRTFFSLAQLADATTVAGAEINGETCRGISFVPTTTDATWEQYFSDITCTIWLTRDNHIARSEICATASAAGQTSTLTLTGDYADWNTTAPITPPLVTPAT